ncbi:hypothetical protein Tco_0145990 [Tanacetum coccineum]
MHRHVIHHLKGYLFRELLLFVELDYGDTVSRNVLILGIPSPFDIVIAVRVAVDWVLERSQLVQLYSIGSATTLKPDKHLSTKEIVELFISATSRKTRVAIHPGTTK